MLKETAICKTCKIEKLVTEFGFRKNPVRRNECKICRNVRAKAMRPKNAYLKYWKDNRLQHKKTRNRQRKRNYDKSRVHAIHSRDIWTLDQLKRIIDTSRPCDRDLAIELGRSVAAIQVMRTKVR